MNPRNKFPNSQLHIAVIEPSGRLYGSEYCLLDIVDGCDRDQFRWTVLMPAGNGFDEVLLKRDIDCEFVMLADSGRARRLRRARAYARMMYRLWRLRPDVLYVNQTGSLRAAALFARRLRLPVVCQVQTLEDARWLSDRPHLQQNVQAFICNSQYIADQTRIDDAKKCILYQGMPQARIDRAIVNARKSRTLVSTDSFIIGILGRIAVSKGHYLLLEAAKQLVDQIEGCRFVVIGEGLTQTDTDAYRTAVKQAGLADRFEFRGYRTDIESELAKVDVLAIPSIAEPLGRVLFDAAEFGVPVVVADSGGLGEVSDRFSIGLRFKAEDSGALADALVIADRKYDEVVSVFGVAAVNMFERLPSHSYITAVERILSRAAERQTTAEVWLGDESASTIVTTNP